MNLNPIQANLNEVITDGMIILFSYKTPVAVRIGHNEYYRTSTKWSQTTSRHINKWLDGVIATEKDQSYFDSLI